jgi:MFS family permease
MRCPSCRIVSRAADGLFRTRAVALALAARRHAGPSPMEGPLRPTNDERPVSTVNLGRGTASRYADFQQFLVTGNCMDNETTVSSARHEAFISPAGGIYPGWLAVLASMLALSIGPNTLLLFCFGIFVTPISQEFGWSVASISVGATILGITGTVIFLIQGRLVDRFGGRRLALVSIPLMSAGVAALYFLPARLTVFYSACVIVPLLAFGAWPISYLQLVASWFERRLGLALGLTNAGIGIGAACLPPLATHLIANYGWRTTYAILGALALLVTWPVAWFCLRDRGYARRAPSRPVLRIDGLSFGAACRTPAFYLSSVAFVLLGIASAVAVVHQIRILIDFGMTPQRAAAMQALFGAALIVGRVVTGWLLDRAPLSIVMGASCVAAAGAFAALASGVPTGVVPVCSALLGFVVGAEFDVLSFLVPKYFGRKAFGTLYATIYAAFQFSSAISISVVGVSRVRLGSYVPALWTVAALMVACALCFLILGNCRRGPADGGAFARDTAARLT